MGEFTIVNSEPSLIAHLRQCREDYDKHKYLTYLPPRIGKDRSLTQNGLLHVWLTEFACHLAKCHKDDVTEGMREGMKRSVKGLFYREYPYEWMVHKVMCPLTKREKTDYTSSASWKHGEMFLVLTFLQNFAATKGCVLESRGEFAKKQREQNE